jgi:hypothetical protein
MIAATLLLAFATTPTAFTFVGGAKVAIALTPDREVYHVGEAIQLTLTVANIGEQPLYGYMMLEPYMPSDLKSSALLYCRDGSACIEFLGKIRNVEYMDMEVTPIQLYPGQRQKSVFIAALNPKTKTLVADAAGDYELRWTTWGIHERRGHGPKVRGPELSASAFVRVLPVPASERAAFACYVENDLGQMAQYDEAYGDYTARLHQAAHSMLRRYGDSIYSDAVRRGFITALESRERRGRATPEDRERLAELRARVSARPLN